MTQTSHKETNGNSVKIDIPLRVINTLLMGIIAFFISPLNPIREGIPTQKSNKIESDEVVKLLREIKDGQDRLNNIFTKLAIPTEDEIVPSTPPRQQRRRIYPPSTWFRNRLEAKYKKKDNLAELRLWADIPLVSPDPDRRP